MVLRRVESNVLREHSPDELCGPQEPRVTRPSRRRQQADECDHFRTLIRPILDFYAGQIAANPDLAEHRTMVAVLMAEIESFNSPRQIRSALSDVRFIFGHDRRTLHVERGSEHEERFTRAVEAWKRLTGRDAPILIEAVVKEAVGAPTQQQAAS